MNQQPVGIRRDYSGQKLVDYLSKSGPVARVYDDGLCCLGADDLGFDWGGLLSAGGGYMTAIADKTESDRAQEKLDVASRQKLDAAVAADNAVANALARADVSQQLKSKSALADAQAAKTAVAAQDAAAADLPPDAQAARAAAADKQLVDATARAKSSPKDGYVAALVRAWTATVDKVHNAGSSGGKSGSSQQESWWTRRVIGPVPGYGVVVGGGVLGLIVKKIFF